MRPPPSNYPPPDFEHRLICCSGNAIGFISGGSQFEFRYLTGYAEIFRDFFKFLMVVPWIGPRCSASRFLPIHYSWSFPSLILSVQRLELKQCRYNAVWWINHRYRPLENHNTFSRARIISCKQDGFYFRVWTKLGLNTTTHPLTFCYFLRRWFQIVSL